MSYSSLSLSLRYYKGAWLPKRPPHLCKIINKEECEILLRKKGFLVRNIYDFDMNEPTEFWYVIKDTFAGMTELKSKTRTMIRKAQKCYDFKQVSMEKIFEVGLPIFNSALEDYRIKGKPLSQKEMEDKILHETAAGKAEFWCACEKDSDNVVALAINTVFEDCCEYNILKAIPFFLHNNTYPYYGLIYEMNSYYLDKMKLKYVNDGSRTITEHSNIQTFLIDKFNFRKAYCRLQIEYKWWFKKLVFILFPFRRLVPILSVKAILNLEDMRRKSCSVK